MRQVWTQRTLRNEIEDWLQEKKEANQPIPTRKEMKLAFPNAPLKVIRAVLQSMRDTVSD